MNFVINYSTLLIVTVSFVIATGIVWRVEKRLDLSFKFFQIACAIFGVIMILNILSDTLGYSNFDPLRIYLRLLFAIFFLFGLWEMRTIVRELDGELQQQKERKRTLPPRR
ncbi:MAG: hypothetical protein HY422_00480 [Candidatus Komeilibacteria bacterium]|nr:hypothetical protein [Candidatus Komeilibacteria bacterium]